MRVAYLDFNLKNSVIECYSSLNSSRYGGGSAFSPWAREVWDDFHIYANPKCFYNLTNSEKKDKCHWLTDEQRQDIFDSKPIKDIIPEIVNFDLIVHHHCSQWVNTDGLDIKSCCWVIGYLEDCHPKNTNLLFFNFDGQKSRLKHNDHKIYKIQLGKPVPEFKEYKKENIIFQCSRHNSIFRSIQVADICNRHNIPVYFAGKIDENYPLLDFIDRST